MLTHRGADCLKHTQTSVSLGLPDLLQCNSKPLLCCGGISTAFAQVSSCQLPPACICFYALGRFRCSQSRCSKNNFGSVPKPEGVLYKIQYIVFEWLLQGLQIFNSTDSPRSSSRSAVNNPPHSLLLKAVKLFIWGLFEITLACNFTLSESPEFNALT